MKIRILKGVAFPNPENKEYQVGEIVETTEDWAKSLEIAGMAEIVEEEKSFEEPPEDKMVKKGKKK